MKTAYSAGFEGGPVIGRANLLVSRIMMFAIIDRNSATSTEFKKMAHQEVRPPK